jgi:hypothetical protein
MPKEKHPILYNVVGGVLAGLILAGILYFVPGAYQWLARYGKPCGFSLLGGFRPRFGYLLFSPFFLS